MTGSGNISGSVPDPSSFTPSPTIGQGEQAGGTQGTKQKTQLSASVFSGSSVTTAAPSSLPAKIAGPDTPFLQGPLTDQGTGTTKVGQEVLERALTDAGYWDLSDEQMSHLYGKLAGAQTIAEFQTIFEHTTQLELARVLQDLPPELAEALMEIPEDDLNWDGDLDDLESSTEEFGLFGSSRSRFSRKGRAGADQQGAFGGQPGQEPSEAFLKSLGLSDEVLAMLRNSQLTDKELNYLNKTQAIDETINPEGIKQQFRFVGNYLQSMVKVLSTLNTLKSKLSSVEGDMLQVQTEAENKAVRAQTDLAYRKLAETKELREKQARLSSNDAAKWANFGIMTSVALITMALSIAITVITVGAATPIAIGLMAAAITLMVGVTTATIALNALETAGINVFGELVEALGGDEEDHAWIAKLVVAVAVIAVAGVMAIVGAVASPGMALIAVGLVPQMISFSNGVFEVVFRIAKAAGMEEDDAMWLAFSLNIFVTVIITVAFVAISMKMSGAGAGSVDDATSGVNSADDLAGAADDATATANTSKAADSADTATDAAGKASTTSAKATDSLTAKAKLRDMLSKVQEMAKGERVGDIIEVIDMLTRIIQLVSSLMMGISELQRAEMTKEVAELKHAVDSLDILLEFLKASLPMFRRTREGIMEDMQNGMMKLATDMHKIFDNAVQGASQASTERARAIRT